MDKEENIETTPRQSTVSQAASLQAPTLPTEQEQEKDSESEEERLAALRALPPTVSSPREVAVFRTGFEAGAAWARSVSTLPPPQPAVSASKPNAAATRRAIVTLYGELCRLTAQARFSAALSPAEVLEAVTPFVAEVICTDCLTSGNAARRGITQFSAALRSLVGNALNESRRRKHSKHSKPKNINNNEAI